MNPIAIVLIGMAVVVGGVLALRLHAFLALILGALVVAALTPGETVRDMKLRSTTLSIVEISTDGRTAIVNAGWEDGLAAGMRIMAFRSTVSGDRLDVNFPIDVISIEEPLGGKRLATVHSLGNEEAQFFQDEDIIIDRKSVV